MGLAYNMIKRNCSANSFLFLCYSNKRSSFKKTQYHQRIYNSYFKKRQHELVPNVKTKQQKAKYGGSVAVFCLHGKAGFLCEPLSSFNIGRGNGNEDILCKKKNLFSIKGGQRIATSLGSKH